MLGEYIFFIFGIQDILERKSSMLHARIYRGTAKLTTGEFRVIVLIPYIVKNTLLAIHLEMCR